MAFYPPRDTGGGGGGGGAVDSVTGTAPVLASPTTGDVIVTVSEVDETIAGVVPLLANVDGAVPVDSGGGAGLVHRRLTQDDIDAAFSITSFARAGTFPDPLELGDSLVNPRFTATYNAALTTPLNLINTQGPNTDPITQPGAEASFGYNDFNTSGLPARTFTRTTQGAISWTLSAKKNPGGPTRTAVISNSWLPRVYRGIVVPGANTEAFIEALGISALQSSRNGTYAFAAGTGVEKIHFGWPTTFSGTPLFKDGNGFVFPMTLIATGISVTNSFGAVVNYDLWRSDNFLSSAFTLTVT